MYVLLCTNAVTIIITRWARHLEQRGREQIRLRKTRLPPTATKMALFKTDRHGLNSLRKKSYVAIKSCLYPFLKKEPLTRTRPAKKDRCIFVCNWRGIVVWSWNCSFLRPFSVANYFVIDDVQGEISNAAIITGKGGAKYVFLHQDTCSPSLFFTCNDSDKRATIIIITISGGGIRGPFQPHPFFTIITFSSSSRCAWLKKGINSMVNA